MRDDIYKEPLEKISKFEFSEKVVAVFDDMIHRSVPFYAANQIMAGQMAAEFYIGGSVIYDLGCSKGKTAETLDEVFGNRPFKYVGIDNSAPMIESARKLGQSYNKNNEINFIVSDIESFEYKNAGVVIANYTFQFIAPERRLNLLKSIFSSLTESGILLLSEKVIESDKVISEHFINMHHRMKKAHGYSDLEIIQKRDALEDVLIPNSTENNIELLKEAGFSAVSIYHKWYNFASYIALKK